MKIYNYNTIQKWEQFSIVEENTNDSILMERAATHFANWIDKKLLKDNMSIAVICGRSNNAGDGYAVARILQDRKSPVTCFSLFRDNLSPLCASMKKQFHGPILEVESKDDLKTIADFDLVIDAILGIGASRPFDLDVEKLVLYINKHSKYIMSIDIPSGMQIDKATQHTSIEAVETLTFSQPHLAFFSSTNEKRLGTWIVKSIGLSRNFDEATSTYYIDRDFIKGRIKSRSKFGHKGNYGKLLLIGGQQNSAGAIYLSANAALRLGAGLVTIASEESNRVILQTLLPEAQFVSLDNHFSNVGPSVNQYHIIGIGPGMGISNVKAKQVFDLIDSCDKPMVFDADALNNICLNPMTVRFSKDSIITPHPKEFDRLFGESQNDMDRRDLQIQMSKKHAIYIILKGAYSTISNPEGEIYYNSTGNPGMATGGSGDILTGMLCALLGQGYSYLESCLLGTYLHGLAGDVAAKEKGEMNMISSDIISYFGIAINMIK